eukprot:COSAG01_NODE_249_length_20357_cov_3.458171_10_plen_90_part_00
MKNLLRLAIRGACFRQPRSRRVRQLGESWMSAGAWPVRSRTRLRADIAQVGAVETCTGDVGFVRPPQHGYGSPQQAPPTYRLGRVVVGG